MGTDDFEKEPSMNISQLEYLVASVKSGSYAEAAKRLFVTPRAISKSINDLERELGVSLLTRAGRSVKPTPFALDICNHADIILSTIEEIRLKANEQMPSKSSSSTLSIAICSSPCRGNVFPIDKLSSFFATNPLTRLSAHYHTNESCFLSIEAGLVDAAIVLGNKESEAFSCRKLASVFPLVATRQENNHLPPRDIEAADLAGQKIAVPSDIAYAYKTISSNFQLHDVDVSFVPISPIHEEHVRFLEEGGAVFLLPFENELTSETNVRVKPTSRKSGFSLSLNYARRRGNEPVLDSLFWYLKRAIRNV